MDLKGHQEAGIGIDWIASTERAPPDCLFRWFGWEPTASASVDKRGSRETVADRATEIKRTDDAKCPDILRLATSDRGFQGSTLLRDRMSFCAESLSHGRYRSEVRSPLTCAANRQARPQEVDKDVHQ